MQITGAISLRCILLFEQPLQKRRIFDRFLIRQRYFKSKMGDIVVEYLLNIEVLLLLLQNPNILNEFQQLWVELKFGEPEQCCQIVRLLEKSYEFEETDGESLFELVQLGAEGGLVYLLLGVVGCLFEGDVQMNQDRYQAVEFVNQR